MSENKSLLRRVVEFPEKLTLAIEAGLVWVSVQVAAWLAGYFPGVDFAGAFLPLTAAFAIFLAWVLKTALEFIVPDKFHYIVNAVLGWLAMLVGTSMLYQYVTG